MSLVAVEHEIPIIHVGLPKTGTTFLQNNFFNKITNVHYVTPHKSWDESFNWIFKINKDFDNLSKITTNETRPISLNTKEYSYYVKNSKEYLSLINKRLLLSSEGLCGASFSPLKNNLEVAKMLYNIYGKSKIIFIFREQFSFCESVYRQLVFKEDRYSEYIPFEEMYGFDNSNNAMSLVKELNWYQVYMNYCEIFGHDNVLALPYEYMKVDLQRFVSKLQDFMEVNPLLENDFYTQRDNISKKQSIYKMGSRWKNFGFQKKIIFSGLSQELKKKIKQEVETSNRSLSKVLNIDLEKYGYFHNINESI